MKISYKIIFIAVLIIVSGCARPSPEKIPVEKPRPSMRLTNAPARISDDIGIEKLAEALEHNINRLMEVETDYLSFGPDVIDKDQYIRSLQYIADKIKEGFPDKEITEIIRKNFNFYEVQGKEEWGRVFITSYYEPVLLGSRKRTNTYNQPIYSVPSNLVKIHMDEFVDQFNRLSPMQDQIDSGNRHLYGRLIKTDWGTPYSVVPYYTREEIDRAGILDGKGLEIAWVDPVDAFFLHIQGSGTIVFRDGTEIRVGYASQNGHTYRAIGKFLYSVIPPEKMSKQAIEKYLRSIPSVDMRNILYKNPSYIFFTRLKGAPVTSFGTEVVEGRTIATDTSYYPKGALAYMEFEKPVFHDKTSAEPAEWEKTSRFVIDQDTGGAIKGPHRVDLFWGRGESAEKRAGVMKNWGTLYYLAPNKAFLNELSKR